MSSPLGIGAGPGALKDAQFVVIAASAALPNERVLTQTANRIVVTDGGAGATVTLSPGALIVQTDQPNTWTVGTQQIETGAAGTIGLIVKGNAGQTANLTEWQDSAGNVLTSINYTGNFGVRGNPSAIASLSVVRLWDAGGGGTQYASRYTATVPAATVGAIGFRSFSLEAYLNNTGVVGGSLYGGKIFVDQAGSGSTATVYGMSIGIRATHASSTINTVYIFRAEDRSVGAGAIINNHAFYADSQTAGNNNWAIYTNAGDVRFGDSVLIDNLTTTKVPLTIQGAAAQTAALFQLQDSTSGVVVDSGDGLASSEWVHNQGGIDIDYRVESLTYDAIIVDAATDGLKLMDNAAGLIGFFGTAPVNQRAKANFNNWAAFTDVVDALVSLGLFDAA